MKIAHLMLSNFYIDNAYYQENIIPKINKDSGNEVLIIASTEVFNSSGILDYTKPKEYFNSDGIKVIRLPYIKVISRFLSAKIRAYKNLYNKIDDFKPDIIMFHGAAAWALNTVSKYKQYNPDVVFYVDSHEDKHNSARTKLSRILLYNCFYSKILRKNIKYIDKLFYITKETYKFNRDIYKIQEDKLFFLPLGGIVPNKDVRKFERKRLRSELNLKDDDFLCIHSGKLTEGKRTQEIIKGFSSFKNKRFYLVIIGELDTNIESEIKNLISGDSRIIFLGWKSSNDLQKYLMAGDLYIQLGTQSVTMQQALCCGCVASIYPYESHKYLLNDNVFYIETEKDITCLLQKIDQNVENFNCKRTKSFQFAKRNLDYDIISSVISKL